MSRTVLRIAVVTETWPPEVNGVAMTMSRLVTGLRDRGHAVQVIRPRQKTESAPKPDEVLTRSLPLPGYNGLQLGVPSARLLRRVWQHHRPDVVHIVTEGPLGWSALQTAHALSIPVTSSFHTNFDSYSKHYGAALVAPLVRAWLHRFHRRTSSTMAPTRELVNRLERAGIPDARLLGRGVDTTLFDPAHRDAELRRTWGASEHSPVVLYVGRLAPEKNLALASRAFAAIAAANPLARMVWVGDGPSRVELERQSPNHVFAGTRNGVELARHYASADVFLFPSLTETYGNVVPEAMASGLGVVSYHTAAAQELITSEHDGLTAAPHDESAFVAAAQRMARERDLLARCRSAARQRVLPITWNAVVADFEASLRRAIVKAVPLRLCVDS